MLYRCGGTISLVPGVYAYSTMIGILNIAIAVPVVIGGQLAEAVSDGMKTGLILIAIASGISAPTRLFHRHNTSGVNGLLRKRRFP